MRKLKKALSLSLALVLSLALAVPAFAAEKLKVSITFDGYLRTEYVKDDGENVFMAVQVVKDGSNVKLECPGAERLVVEYEYDRTLEVYSLQQTKGAGWVPGPAAPFLDGLSWDFDGVVVDASTKTFAATSADAGSTVFVIGVPSLDIYDDSCFDVKETFWMSESGYAQLAPEHKGVPGPGSEIRGVVGSDQPTQPTTPTEPEQPTPPATPSTPDAPGSYTVKKGDTWSTICTNFYGTNAQRYALQKANKGVALKEGTVITLPEKLGKDTLISAPVAGAGEKLYTVKAGDTLGKIAAAEYGKVSEYKTIFERNTDRLKNANTIYEGQVIVLPVKK
jgi:nucleoid-associated protein YgaU